MKKQNLKSMFLVIYLIFGLGLAFAQEEPEPKPQPVPVRQPRMGEQPRPRTRVSMTDPNAPAATGRPAVQEQPRPQAQDPFLVMEKNHQELIGQLTEIKKMAEEEGASRTAGALQGLIDKRNEEYRKNVEEMQNRRMEMQRRIQERMSRRQQPQAPAAVGEKKSEPAAARKEKQGADGKKDPLK